MNPPADQPVLAGLTAGSLYTGIGGLDLALEHHCARIVWQAETDPYRAAVLAERWRVFDPGQAAKTLARTWAQRQTSLTDQQGMSHR